MKISNFYDTTDEYQALCSELASTAEKSGTQSIDSSVATIKENNLIDHMMYIML